MRNTKTTTQTKIATISNQLTSLSSQRSTWEAGSYKQSNDELYAILDGCHRLLGELRASTKSRKQLNAALEQAGFPVQSNTSLELKVVRAVFGTDGHRAFGYVRVLQVAAAVPNSQNFCSATQRLPCSLIFSRMNPSLSLRMYLPTPLPRATMSESMMVWIGLICSS